MTDGTSDTKDLRSTNITGRQGKKTNREKSHFMKE
nr:MAG TPA: hypothetical protein [Caudoviricetes sp.]